MFSSLSALAELINPSKCMCCKASGMVMCHSCAGPWRAQAICTSLSNIPFCTVVKYDQNASSVILAAKEFGSVAAIDLLVTALSTAIHRAMRNSYSEILLVNIPSRLAANRKRGRNHSFELIRRLAQETSSPENPVDYLQIFRHVRKVRDQANLNNQERFANLHKSLSVNLETLPRIAGKDLIIVDDVVTSGASAAEGIRALYHVGIKPLCVISAAANPRFFPMGYR